MRCVIVYFLVLFVTGVTSVRYVRVGCLKDRSSRILKEKATALDVNSPWHCQKFCAEYTYFGVEYAKTCFCGNELIPPVISSTGCTMSCSGNGYLMCGGFWAIDVYRRSDR